MFLQPTFVPETNTLNVIHFNIIGLFIITRAEIFARLTTMILHQQFCFQIHFFYNTLFFNSMIKLVCQKKVTLILKVMWDKKVFIGNPVELNSPALFIHLNKHHSEYAVYVLVLQGVALKTAREYL